MAKRKKEQMDNDHSNSMQKTKNWATRSPLKTGG